MSSIVLSKQTLSGTRYTADQSKKTRDREQIRDDVVDTTRSQPRAQRVSFLSALLKAFSAFSA